MNSGLVGAVIGSIIGMLGAVLGTYFSIKNTKGPRERAFMNRVAIIAWLTVLTFIGLMFVLPGYYKHLLWIPYSIALAVAIKTVNREQLEIRRDESST